MNIFVIEKSTFDHNGSELLPVSIQSNKKTHKNELKFITDFFI